MKKILLSLITLFFFSSFVNAQIPNYSFEDWTTVGTYEEPNLWYSMNELTSQLGVLTCEKGTPGNPGSYYLKLTSRNILGMGVVPGIAMSGTMDANSEDVYGFPFEQRPANLTGKWQHMVYGGSQGFISVELTKWDPIAQQRISIASINYTLTGMAMSWANFSLPLTYNSTSTPDSCIILFSASGETPSNNDYIYIDNLAFSGVVNGIDENITSKVNTIYPNPANDYIVIDHNFSMNESVTIQITNILGEVLLVDKINQELQNINIQNFNNGIYFITLSSNNKRETHKFIISK